MAEERLWRAVVDESGSDARRDAGTYILAAAVCYEENLDDVRQAMATLLLPGQQKVHWRDESAARRLSITKTLTTLPVEHVVVVRTNSHAERLQRRRLKALESLWQALGEIEVRYAVLESRGPKDDARDRQHLERLRSRKHVDTQLKIDHQPGRSDPLLWVPDAVCGAVSSARTGTPAYQELLSSSMSLTLVDLGA